MGTTAQLQGKRFCVMSMFLPTNDRVKQLLIDLYTDEEQRTAAERMIKVPMEYLGRPFRRFLERGVQLQLYPAHRIVAETISIRQITPQQLPQ